MHNITLINSVHTELGKCNSYELYKIIERIRPEVIFEELPPDIFDIYDEGQTPASLEAKTIKEYLKNHRIEHVPVDTYETTEIKYEDTAFYNNIFNTNIEYINLLRQQLFMMNQYGFWFLNSNQSVELIERLHFVEENVITNMNDEKLSCIYSSLRELHDKRENEMLKNIYRYCGEHEFDRGLFLIGSAHRKSIINKIQEYEKTAELKLNWNYGDYENIL